MHRWAILLYTVIVAMGCGTAKSSFNPNKKYSPAQLEKDYYVFEHVLEESHPSLYWWRPKDSIDQYFDWGRNQIKDSLTEPQFRRVLSYVLAKIDCGHTTTRPSKKYSKYLDTVKTQAFFPLSLKFWQDTVVVAANLNRRDTILKRGTIIQAIDHRSMKQIEDSLFEFISSDGYNITHKYQYLSNRGSFGSLYSGVYGMSNRHVVDYLDSLGKKHSYTISVFNPQRDSVERAVLRPPPRPSRKERRRRNLLDTRVLQLDTASHIALMNLNSFVRGYRLKKFLRASFKELKKTNTEYLVIDVRGNGGGSVMNSTFLTKYIATRKFKLADSLYAVTRHSHYKQYINEYFFNHLFMLFFTRKKKDDRYHFVYFERHYFHPKKRNHFDGKTYVLIGGNSFSATTLFANAVIKEKNVTVVGEETGGGAYGNTAWLIPDVKLPETRIGFRLPLFRLVMDKNSPKTGRGIQPEVEAGPTVEAIKRNADYKMEKVMELIQRARK